MEASVWEQLAGTRGTLDQAVYDLFELRDDERDRIEELCDLDMDLFYRGMKSDAVVPLDWPKEIVRVGRRADLDAKQADKNDLCQYVKTFLDLWEPQLDDQGGRLRWRVLRPSEVSSMTAVIFETETPFEMLPAPRTNDEDEWTNLLARLDESTLTPYRSKRVYIDGLVRIVTDSEIAIIKRNEHRLWTRSSARDDAEATMVIAAQIFDELTEE